MGGGLVGWRGLLLLLLLLKRRRRRRRRDTKRGGLLSSPSGVMDDSGVSPPLSLGCWTIRSGYTHVHIQYTCVCEPPGCTHTHTPFYFEYHQLNEAWHTTTTSLPLSTLYHAGSFFLAAFKCPQYVTHACMNACIPANTRALCLCTHTHTQRQ